jgi:hypothetical protein
LSVYCHVDPGELMHRHRPSLDGAFDAWSSLALEGHDAWPSVDGRRLYYSRGISGDVYQLDLSKSGAGQRVLTNALGALDASPALSSDELSIFVSRLEEYKLDTDVWFAVREAQGQPFDAATRVPELSSSFGERPGALSPDGCRLYFMRQKAAGAGAPWELLVAEKPPKP